MTKLAPHRLWSCGLVFAAASLCPGAVRSEPGALRQIASIELAGTSGRLDHLAHAPEQNLLFIAGLGAGTVDVIDLRANRRVRQLKGIRRPQGLAYAPALGRLFVASSEPGSVEAFDQGRRVFVVPDLPDADNLRLDASADRLYVGYDGGVAAIDARSGKLLQRIALPGHAEGFELAGDRIYVNVPVAGAVLVVEKSSGRIAAQWSVKPARGNFPLALDASAGRLFVATRDPPQLQMFATDSGARLQQMPICGDADDLMLDGRGHLFAICGDGRVAVIDTADRSRLAMQQTLATAPGARTGLWVPVAGVLFVAAPARGARSAMVLVLSEP